MKAPGGVVVEVDGNRWEGLMHKYVYMIIYVSISYIYIIYIYHICYFFL